MRGDRGSLRLSGALGLTLAAALVWGLAHLLAGRRAAGAALLAAQVLLVAGLTAAATALRPEVLALVARPGRLAGLAVAAVLLGLAWATVIVSSYRLVRPPGLDGPGRSLGRAAVGVMCAAALLPTLYAARLAYVGRDVVTTVFATRGAASADPWQGRYRVNVLLLGADAAARRPGARTDSMSVAAVDTRTGRTVLFSLPRNLQHVPMPAGPARRMFPGGFAGDGTLNHPGLLNEVYQWAEDHPEAVPGVPAGRRGPELLKRTIGGILGLPIDYYAMVDMKGFARIIDATGGVRVTVKNDIPYGLAGGVLRAGTRRLSGAEALWFGRSRSDGDDYVRMGRQRCLLDAVARQADPFTVIRSFGRLADAAKRYISTDIPQESLPAFITLSRKIKDAPLESVQFVPPLIDTAAPDWALIREKVSETTGVPLPASTRTRRGAPGDPAASGSRASATPSSISPQTEQTSPNASCN
ncbi:LCP family protein [Sphaerisporangium sp. NPDC005289]|uniref:LCP family protein n=1 Tax=Sphaerisporangium sp. NPDC005289 TaxID=3155247 RepID=UPI0033A3ECB9